MVTGANDYSTQIRDFVARNLLFSESGFSYDDDASFLDEGIIDSLGVIELVTFVEKRYGVSVLDHELVPNNFDSVNKLSTYIAQKLSTKV